MHTSGYAYALEPAKPRLRASEAAVSASKRAEEALCLAAMEDYQRPTAASRLAIWSAVEGLIKAAEAN